LRDICQRLIRQYAIWVRFDFLPDDHQQVSLSTSGHN